MTSIDLDRTLPNEGLRAFEKEYTSIASRMSAHDLASVEKEIVNIANSHSKRLFAYCICFTFQRISKNNRYCLNLFHEHKDLFSETFSLKHTFAIAVKLTGRRRDIEASVGFARSALKIAPNHSGALHNLSESLLLKSRFFSSTSKERKDLLEEASDVVDDAIRLESEYAKFYATKARIEALRGNYPEAKHAVTHAIEQEDSSRADYALRISDYLATKSEIDLSEAITLAKEDAKEQLEGVLIDLRRSNIEVLSFFAAIISFIIAAVNISVSFKPNEVVGLLFVLAATTLFAVTMFSFVFSRTRQLKNMIASFFATCILVFSGYMAAIYWPAQ